ncbi:MULTISPECIES: DUF4124 domain-containing protein [Methylotenera]|uniref:DUF4124 domain-containing protein n=1 Tax=Methylotenera TaxID=359407 RepID=UPI000370ADB3|nr:MULTISPECIES: DUF4124 domain-containing protein [Methylotenera]
MMKKITFILLLSTSFSLLSISAIADTNKIVKWKDSDGVTHYSDKLPSQEAGRSNTEIRNNGIVIKQNVRADQKNVVDQQKQQEKLAQQRADKVLLASYTNANEIDLACERNLETDYAALQSLAQRKKNMLRSNESNNKTAQTLKAKNKALPATLVEELKQSQLEMDNINQQIAKRKQNMDATRKRYAEEKNRFIALKQNNFNTNEPAMAASLSVQ